MHINTDSMLYLNGLIEKHFLSFIIANFVLMYRFGWLKSFSQEHFSCIYSEKYILASEICIFNHLPFYFLSLICISIMWECF